MDDVARHPPPLHDKDIQVAPVGEIIRAAVEDRPVHWIPNAGNAGDALISAGTTHLFRRHGINFEAVPDISRFDGRNKIVCYGGGGNLVPLYDVARNIIAPLHGQAERFFILPHTIDGNADLLSEFGSNV